jgi:serine/threonine protein kinase
MTHSASTVELGIPFKKAFGITKVHWHKSGGQKDVFKVDKDGELSILKLFKSFGKREIRELKIYDTYQHHKRLPEVDIVTDYGDDKIVFEKVIDGDPLGDIINNYENSYGLIKKLIEDIIEVLEPIWEDRITHRDLKPNNIIISPDGLPWVIDFGIARIDGDLSLTATGFMPRTLSYCAPEQYLGRKELISYRSDYFNLGLIAYNLYYQRHPFGSTDDEISAKYDAGDCSYSSDDDCPLNEFFKATITWDMSNRIRNTKLLLQTLH